MQKPSVSIPEAELECANLKQLAPHVVQQLDDWMQTRFKSYVWLPSIKEKDVDFVIARLNGEMIGRSALVTREVLVGGQPMVVMGIAGVIVKDEYQKKGLGHELLVETMRFVQRSPADFCVLMCNEGLGSLYSRYGFRTIPGQNAVFLQPDGSTHEYKPQDGITMVFEKAGKTWPEGLLDLNGLPF